MKRKPGSPRFPRAGWELQEEASTACREHCRVTPSDQAAPTQPPSLPSRASVPLGWSCGTCTDCAFQTEERGGCFFFFSIFTEDQKKILDLNKLTVISSLKAKHQKSTHTEDFHVCVSHSCPGPAAKERRYQVRAAAQQTAAVTQPQKFIGRFELSSFVTCCSSNTNIVQKGPEVSHAPQ